MKVKTSGEAIAEENDIIHGPPANMAFLPRNRSGSSKQV
jgi:hypothetical protein